jgi:hypothetical protein
MQRTGAFIRHEPSKPLLLPFHCTASPWNTDGYSYLEHSLLFIKRNPQVLYFSCKDVVEWIQSALCSQTALFLFLRFSHIRRHCSAILV